MEITNTELLLLLGKLYVEKEVLIGQAGQGRFLVRAAPDAVLPLAPSAPVAPQPAAPTGEARAMAAGAPFGSAVIGGEDLFAGRAEEPNAAMERSLSHQSS